MQFQNAIITNEGVRIFQAALANNPVVFTKCLFSGSSTPLTGSMTALPEPTWGNGHVTNYAANDNGGDFIIYASATNATDYGYAYGYGIYGYLQNEGIEHETLLVVANYDGNVTYVSEASGPYTRFHFAITIRLSMAAGVLSIAPHYNDLVSDAAFQDLANRTVTTHAAADPNAGDDQTVRGHKEFTDGIGVWDSNNGWGLEVTNIENNEEKHAVLLRTTNGAYYGSTIELVPKTDENHSYTENDIKFNANLIPNGTDLGVGSVNDTWAFGYIRNIYTHAIVGTQQLRIPSAYLSNTLRTPNAEITSLISFYNTRLDDDNIRMVWYDNNNSLAFQTGAVSSKVVFDVPVEFNSTVALNQINATNATISTISSGTMAANEIDATGINTNNIIVSGKTKTYGIEYRGILDRTNFPIATVGYDVPIGAIRLVKIDGLSEEQQLPPGSRLFGYTLIDVALGNDGVTANLKLTTADNQISDSAGNYIVLHSVKRAYGDGAPYALVMKTRADA